MACVWLVFHVGMYFSYMKKTEGQIIYETFALRILCTSVESTGSRLCSPLYNELH